MANKGCEADCWQALEQARQLICCSVPERPPIAFIAALRSTCPRACPVMCHVHVPLSRALGRRQGGAARCRKVACLAQHGTAFAIQLVCYCAVALGSYRAFGRLVMVRFFATTLEFQIGLHASRAPPQPERFLFSLANPLMQAQLG